jgi:phage/plasmid-associated DNA primase
MQAGEISTAQRFVKSWIAEAKRSTKYSIIPTEHLRTIYHVQTEQNPRLSQREFAKRLSRNNIETSRKRHPGASRDANPAKGILVDWTTDDLEIQRLINDYFEDGDQALLQAKNN